MVDSAEKNHEEEMKESAERLIEKSKNQISDDEENEPDILEILDASRDPDQTIDMDMDMDKDLKDAEEKLLKIDNKKKDKTKKSKGKIITDEDDEKIKITFNSYSSYFNKYYGCSFYFTVIFAMSGVICGRVGSDYTIGQWAFDRNGD